MIRVNLWLNFVDTALSAYLYWFTTQYLTIQNTMSTPSIGNRSNRAQTLLFGVTIFVSSALLFSIQPMIAKMLLPLLGGTPAVWNTCMLFFQAVLLCGYSYALLISRWPLKRQLLAQIVILSLAFISLPIGLLPRG